MNQQKQNDQSGRSMIEILGVLALIGILSIGGVRAYEQTTTQHTAGLIRDSILKARTLAKTNTGSAIASEVRRLLKNDLDKYDVSVSNTTQGYNQSYTVNLGYVSPKVCRVIFSKSDMLTNQGVEIKQPTLPDGCNQTTSDTKTTQMSFSFNAN